MKKFTVYGVDFRKPLGEFDTVNEALALAKKNIRKFGRTVRSNEYHKNLYSVYKGKDGKIKVVDLRG